MSDLTHPPSHPRAIEVHNDPFHGQKLDLWISCSALKYADPRRSNSRVVMYMREPGGTKEWKEYARTDVVKGGNKPNFANKITIDYFFDDCVEHLKFTLYNVNPKSGDSDQEPWGEHYCTIADIATAPGEKYEVNLVFQSEQRGIISIRREEPDSCKDVVFMSWEGKIADTFRGNRYLYMVFSRRNEDRTNTVCMRTKGKDPPVWRGLEISIQRLCNNDEERGIRVDVYEVKEGRNQRIGYFVTCVSKLRKGQCNENVYPLGEPGSKRIVFSLTMYKKEQRPTFQDFINGGMQLSFYVAIDFTKSNGDPENQDSLHVINPSRSNQYELAIQAVGQVLEKYDTDKQIPAFGFGGRPNPFTPISHKFPINFNADKPSCYGVNGVLEAYRSCVREVKLDGPTNFAPIIRYVSEEAGKVKDASDYKILLIITDGMYCDEEATKEAIVNAAKCPMSIIIVGVGKENFDGMIELDGDEKRLAFNGKDAERDIVQFVALREHIITEGMQITAQKRFSAKLLEEIPDQVVEYMRGQKLSPNLPPPPYQHNSVPLASAPHIQE